MPTPSYATLSGTVTWSDGTLFDGYLYLGLVMPANSDGVWPTATLSGQGSPQRLPIWTVVPVMSGVFNPQTRVLYNNSLTPPHTQYVAYWYDLNMRRVAPGPTAITVPFSINVSPYVISIPTLTSPSTSNTIPVTGDGYTTAGPVTIPSSYFGLHTLNAVLDVPPLSFAQNRATIVSWIHLEGHGITSVVGSGTPGTYDFSSLDDQVTTALTAGRKIMYTSEKIPSFKTALAGAISTTSGPTSITVASGTVSANGQFIKIDSEMMQITAGGGTTSWTVTRALQGTTGATHLNGATVDIGVYYDSGLNTGPPNAAGTAAWTTFVATLVQRYKGRIEAYEMYNEPDQTWTGTMAQLVSFVQIYHDAVRLYDPAALVVTPVTQVVSYLDAFWTAGGTQDVDVVSFHGYPVAAAPVAEDIVARQITPLKASMVKFGLTAKPIWDTEASWGALSVMPGAANQQAFLAKYYLIQWPNSVQRFYWYSYDDTLDGSTVGFGALYDANHNTTLNGAITAAATSVTFTDGTNIVNGNFVVVGSEVLGIVSGSGATRTVTRAQFGTTAASHLTLSVVGLLLAGAQAYWQVNAWLVGAAMTVPLAMAANGTWTMGLSRANGYQALAVWNSTSTPSYTPASVYTKYRDLTGLVTPVSGAVTLGSAPILFESA